MKCHYITDPEIGPVLIPGCWRVAITYDRSQCHCQIYKKDKVETLKKELERLQDKVETLKKELERIKSSGIHPPLN